MSRFNVKKPLSDAEIERLRAVLESGRGGKNCMTIEAVDGLFACLICSPELVMPSRWMPVVWDGEGPEYESMEEANEIIGLLMRMWDEVARTINNGTYGPMVTHLECTDGVFSEGSNGEALFHGATLLEAADIEAVGEKTRHRVLGWLARHGDLDSEAAEMMRAWPHSGGFSVDGSVRLPDWDRGGMERLARYCARPAFSAERLDRWDGDTWVYRLKRPLAQGEMSLVLTPLELLSRLAALVPPPRRHSVCYYGVLSAHATLREKVIASVGPSGAVQARLHHAARRMDIVSLSLEATGDNQEAGEWDEPETFPRHFPYTWAMLVARIYEVL